MLSFGKLDGQAVEFVTALYQILLRREPDSAGLQQHVDEIMKGDWKGTLERFIHSDEYRLLSETRFGGDAAHLNFSSPMECEFQAPDDILGTMWNHTNSVWSNLGETDALWSVLTDSKFLASSHPNADVIEEFYSSGAGDVDYLNAYLKRAGLHHSEFKTVLEYGCGVGRVTKWLAQQFRHVFAYDISSGHLKIAAENLSRMGVNNVEVRQVRNKTDIQDIAGYDLFFSLIVLQHNPPPIIHYILDRAFSGLNSGGIAFFQVPTFKLNYRFSPSEYLEMKRNKSEMEMHFLPQSAIFNLASKHRMSVLEVRADHCIGNFKSEISNTFLLKKEAL